jgi:2-polyprenyl-3-methyl-5-hydroxy-6-metoxy-1,4-benzoquinol methylase
MPLKSIIYNQDYFRGKISNNPDPSGYDEYGPNIYVSETFDIIADRFLEKSSLSGVNLAGKRVLVIGCAYGYLVKHLVDRGSIAMGWISPASPYPRHHQKYRRN